MYIVINFNQEMTTDELKQSRQKFNYLKNKKSFKGVLNNVSFKEFYNIFYQAFIEANKTYKVRVRF